MLYSAVVIASIDLSLFWLLAKSFLKFVSPRKSTREAFFNNPNSFNLSFKCGKLLNFFLNFPIIPLNKSSAIS